MAAAFRLAAGRRAEKDESGVSGIMALCSLLRCRVGDRSKDKRADCGAEIKLVPEGQPVQSRRTHHVAPPS